MGSEWAKEAVGRAEEITRELAALGGAFSLAYQRREARFALKGRGETVYLSAHDYEKRKGMDWARLKKDVLALAARDEEPAPGEESAGDEEPASDESAPDDEAAPGEDSRD